MNIKNYTSGVQVDLSMGRIERNLVKAGARGIMKEYDEDGNCSSISFQIPSNGVNMGFKIPSLTNSIYQLLMDQYVRPTEKSFEKCTAQSQRTAWKIISDWVDIQVTMIQLDQADVIQVFLPYLHDGKSSLYEKMKDSNFKLLK